MTITICEKTGRPVYETINDVKMPIDYSFNAVNDFVHSDVHFEELQYCCLGMAKEIEKLKGKLAEYMELIDETYENRGVFCEPPKY
jgi:hypothetical protein